MRYFNLSTRELFIALTTIFTLALPLASYAQVSSAPDSATVYFISPEDGDTVSSTFTVKFGLRGMGVAPAGMDVEGTGHHHLLINVQELPDMSLPLPSNDQVRHFGLGQTETDLVLPPGEHTLQLVLGNFAHIPHQEPVLSEKITITVSDQ